MYTKTAPVGELSVLAKQAVLPYREASSTQRLLNFIIDNLLMQYGMAAATGYILTHIVSAFSTGLAAEIFSEDNKTNYLLAIYLVFFFNYLIYYSFCETIFKGLTLGKLITGSCAKRWWKYYFKRCFIAQPLPCASF